MAFQRGDSMNVGPRVGGVELERRIDRPSHGGVQLVRGRAIDLGEDDLQGASLRDDQIENLLVQRRQPLCGVNQTHHASQRRRFHDVALDQDCHLPLDALRLLRSMRKPISRQINERQPVRQVKSEKVPCAPGLRRYRGDYRRLKFFLVAVGLRHFCGSMHKRVQQRGLSHVGNTHHRDLGPARVVLSQSLRHNHLVAQHFSREDIVLRIIHFFRCQPWGLGFPQLPDIHPWPGEDRLHSLLH
mmetsp:Transcript_56966/g.152152  ORF Transcript_56966/g.152152 Transcript_56966/m.152152 type:complete len:243 (+) Transcript_56966:187-915(+)